MLPIEALYAWGMHHTSHAVWFALAGRWLSETKAVPSAPASYNKEMAAAFWDLSADMCNLPREIRAGITSKQF